MSGVVSAPFTAVLLTLTLLGSNVVAQKNVQPISLNTPEHFRGADSGVSGHYSLNADRDLFDAELALAQTKRELLSLVQLYKVLGGGWQE